MIVLLATIFVAMLLAQLALRPIHMIRSGLARLGRGELDVNMDLLDDADSAISATRSGGQRPARGGSHGTRGPARDLESVVDNLEDAVALFAPDGALLFANPAMRPTPATPLAPAPPTIRTGSRSRARSWSGRRRARRCRCRSGGTRLVLANV